MPPYIKRIIGPRVLADRSSLHRGRLAELADLLIIGSHDLSLSHDIRAVLGRITGNRQVLARFKHLAGPADSSQHIRWSCIGNPVLDVAIAVLDVQTESAHAG